MRGGRTSKRTVSRTRRSSSTSDRVCCSGYRLPQQRPCHRAKILSIEHPALRSARVISYKDDTLMGRWDVWIEGDHLPRHRRSDLRETSSQMCSRHQRLRSLKKPLMPLGLDVVWES